MKIVVIDQNAEGRRQRFRALHIGLSFSATNASVPVALLGREDSLQQPQISRQVVQQDQPLALSRDAGDPLARLVRSCVSVSAEKRRPGTAMAIPDNTRADDLR